MLSPLAGRWAPDPLALLALAAVGWLAWVGLRRSPPGRPSTWRRRCLWGGLTAAGLALLPPIDVAAADLAAAHMVQHVLLVLVAAPLLVLGRTASVLQRVLPAAWRRRLAGARGRAGLGVPASRRLWRPAAAWGAHVGVIWLWHAGAAYDAALRDPALHVLEHATFLGTALLVWGVVAGARGAARTDPGLSILVVVGLSLHSVLLALLLTFARAPFYAGYADSAAVWGLTPLADQQLAGVLLWVPAGAVHVAAVLVLVQRWLREADAAAGPGRGLRGPAPG